MPTATITPRQLAATIVVCASDSLEPWRASWSDALGRYFQCDGIADDEEINAAITAAGAGLVHLSKGTFKTDNTVNLDQNGVTLEGEGWWWTGAGSYGGTVIIPQVVMTNSIYMSSWEARLKGVLVHGAGVAGQIEVTGTSNTLDNVCSMVHTNYNLLHDAGGGLLVNRCHFYSGPVTSSRNALTIQGCYFNSASLQFGGGSAIHVINNIFETYTTYAIGGSGSYGWDISNNAFESANVVDSVISFPTGLQGVRIHANYEGPGALTTNFLTLGTSGQAGFADIKGNFNQHPIAIGTFLESGEITTGRQCAGISYNTLVDLTYLKILQKGINQTGYTEFYGAAPPVAGTWAVGDRVWNTAPVSGGTPGWVCTTAGTPGVWSAMSNLA